MTIAIFITKTIISVIISTILASFIAFSILNSDNSVLSPQIKDGYADITLSKNEYLKNNYKNFNNDFIENADEIIGYISKIGLDDLDYSSVIKYSAVVKTDKGKTIANVYALDQSTFQKIIPAITNTKLDRYEIILDSDLANNLSVKQNDEIIVSLSGDRFMHYSDIFTVKFISDVKNDSMNNSLIMTKDYITNILSDNNISSEIYINIDKKNDVDKLNLNLLENDFNINVYTKDDFIYGYETYLHISNVIPIIHALLFSAILLFLYMLNINSRYSAIKTLFDNLKSSRLVMLIGVSEVIISSSIFVFMMAFLTMMFKPLYNYSSIYKGYMASVSIVIIAVITILLYILCLYKIKMKKK